MFTVEVRLPEGHAAAFEALSLEASLNCVACY